LKAKDLFNVAPTIPTALNFNESTFETFYFDTTTITQQCWPAYPLAGTMADIPALATYAQNVHISGRDGIYEVAVPYYNCAVMARSCAFSVIDDAINDPGSLALPQVYWQSYVFSNSDAAKPPNFHVWRAVADDFQFGFLTGTPYVLTET